MNVAAPTMIKTRSFSWDITTRTCFVFFVCCTLIHSVIILSTTSCRRTSSTPARFNPYIMTVNSALKALNATFRSRWTRAYNVFFNSSSVGPTGQLGGVLFCPRTPHKIKLRTFGDPYSCLSLWALLRYRMPPSCIARRRCLSIHRRNTTATCTVMSLVQVLIAH